MWPDMGLPGRCNSHWWLLSIDSIEIPKHLTNNPSTHCLRMGEIMNMNSHIQLHIHMFTSCLKSCTGQTVDLKPTGKEQKNHDEDQSASTTNYNAFLAAVWIGLHCFVSKWFCAFQQGGGEGRRRPSVTSCFDPNAQLRGDDDWEA